MATKKKDAEEQAPAAPKRSDDAQPIVEPKRKQGPQAEQVATPTIDPTLSSDNALSTYETVNDRFPPGTGNQVEETPGKP